MRAIITGAGHYVPDKILSNRDLEKMGLDYSCGLWRRLYLEQCAAEVGHRLNSA